MQPFDNFFSATHEILQKPFPNEAHKHQTMLRVLAKQRLELLKPDFIQKHGLTLSHGPFKGMKFLPRASDGCYIPKLLGVYEQELHSAWSMLKSTRTYDVIIDIGAAEGYYAVGLALLFPNTQVYAHDTNTSAHELITQLAQQNGVSDRVHIGELFTHADFAKFEGKRVLLLCDIEGAEKELLNPALAPALRDIDVVVELHNVFDPTIEEVVCNRFVETHTVDVIRDQQTMAKLPPFTRNYDRLDQMLMCWEYRAGPTPWAVMRVKPQMPAPKRSQN